MAGVAGVGMAFKWFYDYNKGLMEATRLTQQFTGLTGDEMKSVRNEVLAVSNTFGLEFTETMQSANTMSKAFGISVSESLKIMQDGLVSGANANGEFLDTIKEYPRYFKEAGLSAEEWWQSQRKRPRKVSSATRVLTLSRKEIYDFEK